MANGNAQLDNTIEIVTPENIAFRYHVAGPFRRFPAYLIDFVIRLVVIIVLMVISAMVGGGGGGTAVLLLGLFVLEWFYGGFFETVWNGQTPGKLFLGIRVLSTDGQPINAYQAILRNLMRAVDTMPLLSLQIVGLPPLWILPTFTLGLAVMTLSPRFQRMGDLVCHTIVVIDERSWLSGVAKVEDPRAFQLAAYLPTDLRVSRSMARTLSHYVERRKYFSVPRRREVARHLGEPLLREFGLPADTSHDLLLCSMYYRLFIADRGDDERHFAEATAAPGMARPSPSMARPGSR